MSSMYKVWGFILFSDELIVTSDDGVATVAYSTVGKRLSVLLKDLFVLESPLCS
jgi:hypothetical protein